jgi:hypothetical protein
VPLRNAARPPRRKTPRTSEQWKTSAASTPRSKPRNANASWSRPASIETLYDPPVESRQLRSSVAEFFNTVGNGVMEFDFSGLHANRRGGMIDVETREVGGYVGQGPSLRRGSLLSRVDF